MDTQQLWTVVEDQRRRIASFLDQLHAQEWEQPSLCDGWTIKQVAAHLAVVPQAPSLSQMVAMIVRARGSLDQVNHDIACDFARLRTPAQLVATLRDQASDRDLPRVTSVRNLAMDIVVHGQDMAVPLHRSLPVPHDAAVYALERAWGMGWPFHARKRLNGYRIAATDASWTAGDGPQISGTTVALLLLATGRTASALPMLTGPGVALLESRSRHHERRV